MKRWLLPALVLILAQGLLLGAWWLVEHRRRPPDLPAVAWAAFERTGGVAPELRFTRRDGSPGALAVGSERVVVHFWATWCPPCREELPSLLRWSERSGVELLAVSVDPTWDAVEGFLDGRLPPTVVLADGSAAGRWGADELPATFVVERGRLTRVARGPVDWRGAGPARSW